jgi:two-component system, OmpR family, response regulator
MRKKKILVVDDESGFTRLMKIALPQYEIREENDPLNAMKTALSFRPELILLDVIMPGLDGGDLAAQFAEDPVLRNIPIVFLTAIVSPGETGKAARHIGGYPFLAKPVSAESLERCIEEHLAEA